MSLRGLFIGNNYADEACALGDCELDAQMLAETFEPYIASGKVALSKSVRAMLKTTRDWLDTLRKGDVGLLSFSGHGTTEFKDRKTVQAIVGNDLELIYEYELRTVLNDRPQGTTLIMLADCCHSAGLARGAKVKARSVPASLVFSHDVKIPYRLPPAPNATYYACQPHEYAYSTGDGGAMTLAFTAALSERGPRTSLQALHRRVRERLPSNEWPQTPRFTCRAKALAKRTIRSFA